MEPSKRITFVEDPDTKLIHCYLIWQSATGDKFEQVYCEQRSSDGLAWVKIGERVQDDWFERLCPECFPPEEK